MTLIIRTAEVLESKVLRNWPKINLVKMDNFVVIYIGTWNKI